jgi:hypothetical protein
MNIQTVRDNLKNTIAGKEMLLVEYINMRDSLSKEMDAYNALYASWHATVAMLEINIDELKHILQDVEQCQDRHQEGYEDGLDDGYEQSILRERG